MTRGDIKLRTMPRASDGFSFQLALREVPMQMGAVSPNRIESSSKIKYQYLLAVDDEGFHLPGGNIPRFGDFH
jgi:hypothetical protein